MPVCDANGSLLTFAQVSGMPGVVLVQFLGVRDAPTSALPGGARPLEEYATRFDDLFTRLAQRRGFREYLTGLLAPRDRNKTLTGV